MQLPPNWKICQTCKKGFAAVWNDQTHCKTCKPLRIDPELKRIANNLTRRIRGSVYL